MAMVSKAAALTLTQKHAAADEVQRCNVDPQLRPRSTPSFRSNTIHTTPSRWVSLYRFFQGPLELVACASAFDEVSRCVQSLQCRPQVSCHAFTLWNAPRLPSKFAYPFPSLVSRTICVDGLRLTPDPPFAASLFADLAKGVTMAVASLSESFDRLF